MSTISTQIVNDIKDAVEKLNKLIREAVHHDIEVDVSTLRLGVIGQEAETNLLEIKVRKVL
jgi:hypothetical protein